MDPGADPHLFKNQSTSHTSGPTNSVDLGDVQPLAQPIHEEAQGGIGPLEGAFP